MPQCRGQRAASMSSLSLPLWALLRFFIVLPSVFFQNLSYPPTVLLAMSSLLCVKQDSGHLCGLRRFSGSPWKQAETESLSTDSGPCGERKRGMEESGTAVGKPSVPRRLDPKEPLGSQRTTSPTPKQASATAPGRESPRETRAQGPSGQEAESPRRTLQIAPLPSSTLCPICKTSDLTSTPSQPNFNTCTQCHNKVCNQCGFNPNPHLTQRTGVQFLAPTEWLTIICIPVPGAPMPSPPRMHRDIHAGKQPYSYK